MVKNAGCSQRNLSGVAPLPAGAAEGCAIQSTTSCRCNNNVAESSFDVRSLNVTCWPWPWVACSQIFTQCPELILRWVYGIWCHYAPPFSINEKPMCLLPVTWRCKVKIFARAIDRYFFFVSSIMDYKLIQRRRFRAVSEECLKCQNLYSTNFRKFFPHFAPVAEIDRGV